MLKKVEQDPSDPDIPFMKSDRLPQSLARLSALAIVATGLSEQIYTVIPIGTLTLTIASLVYVAKNEAN